MLCEAYYMAHFLSMRFARNCAQLLTIGESRSACVCLSGQGEYVR